MYEFSKILKLLADPKILKAVGDTSAIIDGYLELGSEDRCAVIRDLSKHAEVLIAKVKQNQMNKRDEQEGLDNDSKY